MSFALVFYNQFYYLDFDFLHKPSLTYEVFCTYELWTQAKSTKISLQ